MTFWNEAQVRARKAHRCDECLTAIAPGEQYTRGAGINVYGEFGAWTTHADCLAATREQMELGDAPSGEWWPLHETVWEMDAPALAALALDYPTVFERFRAALEEHERAPVDHYVWRGAPAFYVPARRDWYRWDRP